MPFVIPPPERAKRLVKIQENLAAFKADSEADKLQQAIVLMLEEPQFRRYIAHDKALPKPKMGDEKALLDYAWAYLYQLLSEKDFVAASAVLWDRETFCAEPHCVQLVWEAIMSHHMVCIIGGGGLGKCLGPDVPVMLFDGRTKKAKDVAVGDELMGDDGTKRNVLQANPGRGPLYRIIPQRGDPWICNGDHILSLKASYDKTCGNGRVSSSYPKGSVIDVPLNEYLTWSKTKKERFLAFHVGVEMQEQPVPFDPYIYGAWLGDGGVDVPALHKPFGPVTERWTNYFTSLGMRIHVGYADSPCPMICARTHEKGPNPFTDFIRTSVRDKEKFILDAYLRNSRTNRMQLLAGLIDTDGSVNGCAYEIFSKWEGLARQIMWLARSLGFAATVTPRVKKIKETGFSATYWHVYISGHGITDIPTIQKRAREPLGPKAFTLTSFKVEPIGDGDYYGFVIDGNRRFLLGDFTVTHNTYSSSAYFILEWLLDPYWTRFQVASATDAHLKGNLYADIIRLHQGASLTLPGTPDSESISLDKKRGQGIFTLALPNSTSGKGKIQGSHTKPRPPHPIFGRRSRVFCLIDECQECPQNIFDEIPNRFSTMSKSNVDHLKFVTCANPKDIFSRFGESAKPKGGWASITRNDEVWTSEKGWRVVSLDATKHENVVAKRVIFPGFVTVDGVNNWIYNQCGGNLDDPQLWTYVYGKFPPKGTSRTIIPYKSLTDAEGEWVFDGSTVAKFGFDPAFTGDEPAYATGRVGKAIAWTDYEGKRYELETPRMAIQVDTVDVVVRGDSLELADQVMDFAKTLEIPDDSVGIDRTGAGQGVFDIVRGQWSSKVGELDAESEGVAAICGIHYSESPTTVKICDEDTQVPKDLYDRIASELWFAAGKLFQFGVVKIGKGVDIKVFSELGAREGGMQPGLGKKLTVESKDDYKKRTNKKSPDRADALLIMLHVARITTPGLIARAPGTVAPKSRFLDFTQLRLGGEREGPAFAAVEMSGWGGAKLPDMMKD